jgi:hypothetical protein
MANQNFRRKDVMMKNVIVLLAVLAMFGIANAELIVNGGMESNGGNGTIPDSWNDDFNTYGAYDGAANSGLFCMHPGNGGPPGGEYQDITTVAGQYYDVSLWMQNFGFSAGAGNVKVLVGNSGTDTYTFENGSATTNKYSLTGLFDQNIPTSEDGSWSQATFQFQALGTTTRFGVYNAPPVGNWSTNVDDVSVVVATEVPASNPAPAPDTGNDTYGTVVGSNVEVTLNWDAGADPTGANAVNPAIKAHYVYLSGNQNVAVDPNMTLIATVTQSGQTVLNSYGPITLDPSGSYLWSVEEGLNSGGGSPYPAGSASNIPGPIWSFDTAALVVEIITEPVGDVADPDASFTVVAAAAESYQWYKVGTPDIQLSDAGQYSGTQTATLTLTTPAIADEGQYYCVVSNSVPSQATSASAQLWTARLIGHWKLDGNMLDSVADTVSGAPAHDGAIGINTTVPGPGDENYAGSGIAGSNAMTFHDDGDYVAIPDGDYFNFYQDGFTASCWYKSDTDVGWRLPLNKSDETGEDANLWRGWLLGINAGGVAAVVNPNWQWVGSAAGINYSDGQWHLMTTAYDPSDNSLKYYTDGDWTWEIIVTGLSTPPALSAPLCIGGRDGESSVEGTIDDVRVYSYPLSSQEVATLYTDLKPGESICTSEVDPVFEGIDIDGNCQIDLSDFAVVASKWLDCMLIPSSACP